LSTKDNAWKLSAYFQWGPWIRNFLITCVNCWYIFNLNIYLTFYLYCLLPVEVYIHMYITLVLGVEALSLLQNLTLTLNSMILSTKIGIPWIMRNSQNNKNDQLIDWCLMPTSAIFHLHYIVAWRIIRNFTFFVGRGFLQVLRFPPPIKLTSMI
jgi:hypothetical protein